MDKCFTSLNELLDFNFSKLEPQKSNYLRLTSANGILPTIKKEFHPSKWKTVTHKSTSEIIIEITPRWLTITVHRQKDSIREDFDLLKKDPKSLILEIFEISNSH